MILPLAAWFQVAAAAPPVTVEGVITARGLPVTGTVVALLDVGQPDPPPGDTVVVDQLNLRFVPQTIVVTAGTPVAFRNSDPQQHNVFSPRGLGDGFNLGTYPTGESRTHVFARPGVHVMLCHVHPEMLAYVMVVPSTRTAIADAAGRFRLAGVPPGRYRVQVWHRRLPLHEEDVTVPDAGIRRLEITLSREPRP